MLMFADCDWAVYDESWNIVAFHKKVLMKYEPEGVELDKYSLQPYSFFDMIYLYY